MPLDAPRRRRRSHGSWQMIQTKLWVLVGVLVIIAVLALVGVLAPPVLHL